MLLPIKNFDTDHRFRFDNGGTREFRQRIDKAACIRDIWNFLNENLNDNYDPQGKLYCGRSEGEEREFDQGEM